MPRQIRKSITITKWCNCYAIYIEKYDAGPEGHTIVFKPGYVHQDTGTRTITRPDTTEMLKCLRVAKVLTEKQYERFKNGDLGGN